MERNCSFLIASFLVPLDQMVHHLGTYQSHMQPHQRGQVNPRTSYAMTQRTNQDIA